MSKKLFKTIDYQEDVLQKLAVKFGPQIEEHAILKLPTGSGKTYVATKFLIDNYITKRGRVLWVANRWSHVNQFLKTLSDVKFFYPGLNFKVVIVGEKSNIIISHPGFELDKLDESQAFHDGVIYVSSINTISKQIKDLKNNLSKKLDLVVFDEDHWGKNGTMRTGVLEEISGVSSLGLTATPIRLNNSKEKIDVIGHQYSYIKLAEKELLAKAVNISVNTGITYTINQSGLKIQNFNKLIKGYSLNDHGRMEGIVDYYIKNIDSLGKTFIFCPNAANAEKISELLQEKTKNLQTNFISEAIISKKGSSQKEYLKKIEAFKGHTGPGVLTSIGILCDGVDVPDLQSVFITHSTNSDVKFAQMFGRGARTNDGKKKTFNLVDFKDNFLNGAVAKILNPLCPEFYGDNNSDPDSFGEELGSETNVLPFEIRSAKNQAEVETKSCLTKIKFLIVEKIERMSPKIKGMNVSQVKDSLSKVIVTSILIELHSDFFNEEVNDLIKNTYFDIEWDEMEILTSLVIFNGATESLKQSLDAKLSKFESCNLSGRTLNLFFEQLTSDQDFIQRIIGLHVDEANKKAA